MNKKIITIIFLCTIFFCLSVTAQEKILEPTLSGGSFRVVNRTIRVASEQGKTIVHLDGKPGDGVAWLNNITFEKGIIEFDVKGKNIMQQSFVGIAFHGSDDSTFDAVYFRPFNFQSSDTARKSHSVQYVSLPQYDWSALREKFPGKYESALSVSIQPESWFHAKVVVEANNITVFVNEDDKASLTVQPISKNTTRAIGFWVGNNSDGDFSNLKITSE